MSLVSGSRFELHVAICEFEGDCRDGVEELGRKVTEIYDIWVKEKGLRDETRLCNNTS